MPKSNILIAALLLTNAITGVVLWRSHQEIQYWMNESRALSKQHELASAENESLQEIIFGVKAASPKLFALDITEIGKCVSKNPKNAQDYCVGPETVIKGYQKILNRSGGTFKLDRLFGDINNQTDNEQLQPLPR
jgi:hypothetical protein